MDQYQLISFIKESNKIEGIIYQSNSEMNAQILAYNAFLSLSTITIPDLENFVKVIQPDAILRRDHGVNVKVGNHLPPPGGPQIVMRLDRILNNMSKEGSYWTHLAYEYLHPFTDGNGRSGRMLWLWQMDGTVPLGFLHQFYYQTLGNSDGR